LVNFRRPSSQFDKKGSEKDAKGRTQGLIGKCLGLKERGKGRGKKPPKKEIEWFHKTGAGQKKRQRKNKILRPIK